ncbi:MAG TPA: HNH endonuclease [Novosphingobium sp.]|nr:HNH endonuclease [Novosphingobium sp.]
MPKRRHRGFPEGSDEPLPADCWLCGRTLGVAVEWHHPVPRSRGGRDVRAVHPICHRTLHAQFTNVELARIGEDVASLRAQAAVARFIAWLADKPPDFHAPTRKGPVRAGRRR